MARRFVRALALLAAAALGCQTYSFSPVNHCLIQPGTRRYTLSSVSTADILFVIDDSASMTPSQTKLGTNFNAFISNLNATNVDRVSRGLQPIDFHIAVTTTSVYENFGFGDETCKSTCTGLTGKYCCDSLLQPQLVFHECPTGGGCGAGFACSTTCQGLAGVPMCCSGDGKTAERVPVACPALNVGDTCGAFKIQYGPTAGSCLSPNVWGVATPNAVYPHGDFVALGNNPRILHFDKSLYNTPGKVNRDGYTQQQLMDFFAKLNPADGTYSGNAMVGSCGSGQEQGAMAAKLALQKALAGQQKDVDKAGNPVPAEWPHPGAKLVVAFVGDEDDCSSPEDPMAGIILSGGPGADTCVSNAGGKIFDTPRYLGDYLRTLRPPSLLGAGFIVATDSSTCADLVSTPPVPACTASVDPSPCGSAAGIRFFNLGRDLEGAGSAVVAGPICSADFSPVLDRLAEIVKPPNVLTLPSVPAADEVTLLRIADQQGVTRLICTGPAPAGTATATATANDDWWFTATDHPFSGGDSGAPTVPTRYVYINHTRGTCEANPGETYSADYLGLLPAPSTTNPAGGCATFTDCTAALGGTDASWQCCAGSTCTSKASPAALPSRGTCLCTGTAP